MLAVMRVQTSLLLSVLVLCLVVLAHDAGEVRACTGFRTGVPGQIVMGKSYDWNIGYGLVVFNPVGLKKSSLNLDLQEKPAKWTSMHSSITFDQYGCEMPNGGMNDAGLAIELMVLGQTQYPIPDERPAVNELQFIQYALDSFGSVAEMVEGVELIRIRSAYAQVHYLACDVSGECAAFEWLDGELVLSTGDDMPAPTLANSTYADSAAYLAQFEGFGGDKPLPQSISSLDRFVRASALAQFMADGEVPAAVLAILEAVSQGDFSKWNIVYDLENRVVHFRTLSSQAVKRVALSDFDPSCESGRFILDIDYVEAGDASGAFEPYTLEANQALIEKSIGTIPGLPEVAMEILALYPGTLKCEPAPLPVEPAEGEPDGGVEIAEALDSVEVVSWEEMRGSEVMAEVLEPDSGVVDAGATPIATRGGCSSSPDVARTCHSLVSSGLLFMLLAGAVGFLRVRSAAMVCGSHEESQRIN